jgi:hypothetical protein
MPTDSAKDPRVDRTLEGLPDETRPVATALRELVRDTLPELKETLTWSQPVWVGRGNVVGLMLYPHHVHLSVFRGSELARLFPDIVGTGKSLRHVAVPDVASARRPVLRKILRAAEALDASRYVRGRSGPFRSGGALMRARSIDLVR